MKILLCVSGSISAYKAADVVSQLGKLGHEVQCLMTESAREFVTPTVLETLSGRPALSRLFGPDVSGTEHIRLARWPDVIVFAPLSAHSLARLAHGMADDLPSTVILASDRPLLVAPAMNTIMWNQPAVRENLARLEARGVRVLPPIDGPLACGEEGTGKLPAPEAIVQAILDFAQERTPRAAPLRDQTLLITAGPTTSAIDAVRYLTNPSTGRMGAALAEEALRLGARVIYVLGVDKGVVRPRVLPEWQDRFELTEIHTAEEMAAAALAALPRATGVIATAAVLDYRVKEPRLSKEKRGTDARTLELIPSVDVLAELRSAAKPGQWFFGFAAETDDLEKNAQEKLARKKLDYLFANPIARGGERLETGFAGERNAGVLYSRDGSAEPFALDSKSSLARKLLEKLIPGASP